MPDLYLDPVGGIAGDMVLAALIDLGGDEDAVRAAVDSLGLSGYVIEVAEEKRRGFRGRTVRVTVDGPQPHRHLREIRELLDGAAAPRRARDRAIRIFESLAEAEAKVHGGSPESVHFHEVGAVDSIIDIFGVAVALESLDVDRIYAGVVPLGTGTIVGAHGEFPLPSPATSELLRDRTVYFTGRDGEHCTPTGAAFIAALAEGDRPLNPLRMSGVGVGFGARRAEDGPPNMFRAFLLDESDVAPRVEVLEATLDDITAEWCGFLMERLFAAGALDAYFQAVQMKKNRPGVKVTAICEVGRGQEIAATFFTHSTTLGIRIRQESRRELERRSETVRTPLGDVRVKVALLPDGREVASPEFEDCQAISRDRNLPLRDVYRAAEAAWRATSGD